MRTVEFSFEAGKAIQKLKSGVFLATKNNSDLNVMTVSWCLFGHMWNRPVFQMVVRTSRYTHNIIESADDFSISIPFSDRFDREILFCGTHSKRDVDKIQECKLDMRNGEKIGSPVVGGCDLYHECKILAKTRLLMEKIGDDDFNENSEDGHRHIMYYGEIVNSYTY